jgi:phosphoglycolate phosphatase-like HAD superfamily hydrolase
VVDAEELNVEQNERRDQASPGHDVDWMRELAIHYEQLRRAYPEDRLCVVFDIDGTILDMRHLVVNALLSYDREHGTSYFRGLSPQDISVHESRIDRFLAGMALPTPVKEEVAHWYAGRFWSAEAILTGSHPFAGVLSVIRWFQLQPSTCVALNTGRPEELRQLTLRSLNEVGRAHRVRFETDLLWMNPRGWDHVLDSKVEGLEWLRAQELRLVAVIDNEPANIRAMAEADDSAEILFLHADTIFETQREATPRTVTGTHYGLAGLVSEQELRSRVQFIWHGVNDEANLRQFLASGIQWAECDVRVDPVDQLVLRHDSFQETPWTRSEHSFLLEDCLATLRAGNRGVVLDIKEGDNVPARVLELVGARGFDDSDLCFLGSIETLGEEGMRLISKTRPAAALAFMADFVGPLLLAVPTLAAQVLDTLREWGVNRVAVDWRTTPRMLEILDRFEEHDWDVNIHGVPDLESFLEAALLLPRAVTADFNFPDWHYYGRGSGQRSAYHRYNLIGHA